MRRNFYFICLLFMTGVLFNGCEVEEESLHLEGPEEGILSLQAPILENHDYVNFMEPYESISVNGYNILLEDVVKTEATTTFVYLVKGTGETAQMDSFFIEIPECAGTLVAWSPTQSSKLEAGKLKWNSSVSKDGEQRFSVTFQNDNLTLGIIDVTVLRGGVESLRKILGPCAGVYTLSGNIFIDANGNRYKEGSESGIGGSTITLSQDIDGDGLADYSTDLETSSNGSYSFKVLEGTYKVSVGADLLNDQNYIATTPIEVEVEVTTDKTGVNFGYKLEAFKIISEFKDGTIPLTTEDYKYWIQEIRDAGKPNSDDKKQAMLDLLTKVEKTLLAEPFFFGNDKIKGALDILTRPIKTDLDLFLQQVLTAELNVLSGRGAIKADGTLDSAFNEALLIYAEAVACKMMNSCPKEDFAAMTEVSAQRAPSSSTDIELVTTFNNGSGGL